MGPSSTEVKQQLWSNYEFRDVKIWQVGKGEAYSKRKATESRKSAAGVMEHRAGIFSHLTR